ncbi:MAG: glycosyltransferase family 39 protein [Lewinellaceae bacterium]|nr:glycosyltransferase family 39 protein [Lewinellaceae bacterium]
MDELTYFDQAYAYSHGENNKNIYKIDGTSVTIMPGNYPLGTPLFLSVLILIFGVHGIFLLGAICLVTGIFFLSKLLDAEKIPQELSLLCFIFFPLLISSRTIMSDVPSFFMLSLFYYSLFRENYSKSSTLFIGFIGGISFLFRETNILLCIPFIIEYIIYKKKNYVLVSIGFLLGISLRFISAKFVFGSFLFFKDPGIDFGFEYFLNNLLLYSSFLLILLPFGLITVIKYSGKFKHALWSATCAFLLTYILYEYNGIVTSGVKGVVLSTRFLFPLVPLIILSIGRYFYQNYTQTPNFISISLFSLSILSILTINILGRIYNNDQNKITHAIQEKKGASLIFGSLAVRKYANPLNGLEGRILAEEDICNSNQFRNDSNIYLFDIIRSDSDYHLNQANLNESKYQHFATCISDTLIPVRLIDNTTLIGYKIMPK